MKKPPLSITMLVTLRCNAACAHCCFESNPSRTEAMEDDFAIDLVRQMGETGRVTRVSMTGGEPFLRYKTMLAASAEAARYGMKFSANTNCFWATSVERAREKLAPLVRNGFDGLGVSLDAVHGQFVPAQRVKFAVHAALDLGISLNLNSVYQSGTREQARADLLRDLELSEEALQFYQSIGLKLKLGIQGIVPSGAAAKNFELDDSILEDGDSAAGAHLRERCHQVIYQPIVTTAGDLAVCCSPSSANATGFHDAYKVGNVRDTPLSVLIERMEANPIFTTLWHQGPWALYEIVRAKSPNLLPRQRFVTHCDVCVNVLSSPAARAILCEHFGMAQTGDLVDWALGRKDAPETPPIVQLRRSK